MTVVRYLLVQILAYGIDLGTFLALFSIGAGPLPANVGGKVAAGCAAFVAHRAFTFAGAAHGGVLRQSARYFMLLGLNVPISSACLALLLTLAPEPAVAKVASDIACFALTYVVSKHMVFTGGADTAPETGRRRGL